MTTLHAVHIVTCLPKVPHLYLSSQYRGRESRCTPNLQVSEAGHDLLTRLVNLADIVQIVLFEMAGC